MTTSEKNEYEKLHEACEAGNITSLRSLLEDTAFTECALQRPVKQYNSITQPILNLVDLLKVATAKGHCATVSHLLAFGQEHNVSYVELITRDTAVAAMDGVNGLGVFRIFVETWPEVVELDMGHLGNPLAYAVVKDQIQLTKLLLDEGADPNRRCLAHKGSGHYLRQSVKSSSLEITKTLLQHGARIQFSGAIQEAAKLGRVDVLELLLANGADVNEKLPADVGFLIHNQRYQQASESPLHIAALHDQIHSVRWLLAHGADPNITDAQGRTPVIIAQASTNDRLAETFAA
ncbi:MAG: hypothetical protein Q9195_006224 [Heterodermia aff. obscurata]